MENTFFSPLFAEENFSTMKNGKWPKIKEHAEAYARATTLHGFAYLGETERNSKEK